MQFINRLLLWMILTSLLVSLPLFTQNGDLFESTILVPPNTFTNGIEGPATDSNGNLYAVNYLQSGDIGKVTQEGAVFQFVILPNGSTGNGIRFNSSGEMFVADYTGHNILKVNMTSLEITTYAHESNMNQPNDIAIGANNILYASDPKWANNTGKLWRIDTDGTVTLLEDNMGTTNGIEVSPDENKLYVNESVQLNVWKYDLSPAGEISNKQLLIQFDDYGLDGMRCDIEGNLYIARYEKGTIVKISPEGEVVREIELTGNNPSNIAFGGGDGCTCYVTLADQGSIETFRVDVPGRSWQLKTNVEHEKKTKHNKNSSLKIYPNPTNSYLNFSFDMIRGEPISLTIWNLIGKKIHTSCLNNPTIDSPYSINLDRFPSGVYFIAIQDNHDFSRIGKFTIMK